MSGQGEEFWRLRLRFREYKKLFNNEFHELAQIKNSDLTPGKTGG